MRKFYPFCAALLFSLCFMLPASSLGAQDPGGMDAKYLQKDLGLTDDQVMKLNTLRDDQRSLMQSTSEKRQDLMKKLEDQVKSQAPDSDLQATLSDLDMNHKNIQDLSEKFRTDKDAILTTPQRAKMLLLPKNAARQAMLRRKMSR